MRLHSVTEVITNSSSELFVVSPAENWDAALAELEAQWGPWQQTLEADDPWKAVTFLEWVMGDAVPVEDPDYGDIWGGWEGPRYCDGSEAEEGQPDYYRVFGLPMSFGQYLVYTVLHETSWPGPVMPHFVTSYR